ncbi:MAG: hypothetical protein JWR11_3707 [Mycobacterium sp.]|nr:hypothetical protein [Mycobacterium sp.]
MIRSWLPVLALGLALAGCRMDHAAAGPVTFDLDQPFALGGGQEASINGADLRVRFTDVLEDSRCPKQVECFWTGQARMAIVVQPAGDSPTTLEFNTNPAPGQAVSTVQVGGYTITLRSLDPYPQTPDDATSLEDYRATLSVTKG